MRGGRRRFFHARKREGKESAKSKSAEREGKKRKFAFFPSHTGSPALEPKFSRQGEKGRVLSMMYSTVCWNMKIHNYKRRRGGGGGTDTDGETEVERPEGRDLGGETYKRRMERDGVEQKAWKENQERRRKTGARKYEREKARSAGTRTQKCETWGPKTERKSASGNGSPPPREREGPKKRVPSSELKKN